mmetsp:Transcript_40035/g.74620  ORF Transcript_40035/g.74620 Transcript_40035/m.74620 type:complete len:203 (+) Transcript_40035:66-674(+)
MTGLDHFATTLIFKTAKKLDYKEFIIALAQDWPAAARLGAVVDFVHLPWKKLAVVNFTSPKACQECFEVFKNQVGKAGATFTDFKQAEYQGLSQNLALYLAKANTFDAAHKPHVFCAGVEIPLPTACAKFVTPEVLRAVGANQKVHVHTSEYRRQVTVPLQAKAAECTPSTAPVGDQFAEIRLGDSIIECLQVGESELIFRL